LVRENKKGVKRQWKMMQHGKMRRMTDTGFRGLLIPGRTDTPELSGAGIVLNAHTIGV